MTLSMHFSRLLSSAAATAALFLATAQAPAPSEHFTLDVSKTSSPVKVGEKGSLSIIIHPAAGKKVHEQAPLIAMLKAGKGLTLAKNKLGHADVANPGDKDPEIKVEFTAVEAGLQNATAELQFFVCTEKWCERQQARVQLSVTVQP